MRTFHVFFFVLLATGLTPGCGGSGQTDPITTPASSQQSGGTAPAVGQSDDTSDKDFAVLMMGNSHTSSNGLPNLVRKLMTQAFPDKAILVDRAPASGFLYQLINEPTTVNKFESRQWTHVVLQAQRYSQSQSFEYPTDGARQWIEKTKQQQGTPVLFPEWKQRGRNWEGAYLHTLYSNIADQAPACVSPVGMAWDLALTLRPGLNLHAPDGNHANLAGSLLAALVIMETITDYPADLLLPDDSIDVDADVQDFLGQVATQALDDYPPCERLID